MLLLATFLTTHFAEWKATWPGTLARVGEYGPGVRWENEGLLAALEPDTGECLWTLTLDTPSGFALSDEHIYINSMFGNRITVLSSSLEEVGVISGWYMNDGHSVMLTPDGLLVTYCGLDGAVEFDRSGREIWTWFATDRGYRDDLGRAPKVNRRMDYRRTTIPTYQQVTHCNSAVRVRLDGKDVVLLTMFHQGELIAIDRKTGRHEVLVNGMSNPHSIRKYEAGWLISDSGSDSVVLMHDDFWIRSIVSDGFDWVQDALVYGTRLLIADSGNNRFVWYDIDKLQPLNEVTYVDQWKVYQVDVIEGEWERRLRNYKPNSSPLNCDVSTRPGLS